MADVKKQLCQVCNMCLIICEMICSFFQRWLRECCWEEWRTSQRSLVNLCLRWAPCRDAHTSTIYSNPVRFFRISACFSPFFSTLSLILVLYLSHPPVSSLLLRWTGPMGLCHLLSEVSRRWQSWWRRSGLPLKHAILHRNNHRPHPGSHNLAAFVTFRGRQKNMF